MRPAAVISKGDVPMNTTPRGVDVVNARDGTHALKIGTRTYFIFGDTVVNNEPWFRYTNSMLSTTDSDFSNGIDTSSTVTQNFLNGAVRQWIPETTAEGTYETNNPNKDVTLWPATMFTNPLDNRSYATFAKLLRNRTPGNTYVAVGTGLAEIKGHTVVAERTSFVTSGPTNPATGVREPDVIINANADGGWDTGLALSRDNTFIYMFQAVNTRNGSLPDTSQTSKLYVARASLAGNAFKQPTNWSVCTAATAALGCTTWGNLLTSTKAALVTAGNLDGFAPHASVEWNPYYNAYVMTYAQMSYFNDGNPRWFSNKKVVMRLAPQPYGPWSAATTVHTATEGLPYVGKTHALMNQLNGRTQYLSYALMGNITGSGIVFKQLRYLGARGDLAGDTRTDIAVLGAGGSTIPVATAQSNGTFTVSQLSVASIPGWAAETAVKPVAGDFDGDNRGDIALIGGSTFTTIPIAHTKVDGTYELWNQPVSGFPAQARAPGAKHVAGDFNGDGRDDIALVGGSGWTTVPVALSNGNGTFTVTNNALNDFAYVATLPGAKPVSGDFNGDGRSDIAIVGIQGLSSFAVAYSTGNGTFSVSVVSAPEFQGFASNPSAKVVSGDFDKDGRGDIALTGVSGWTTFPLALGNGTGAFTFAKGNVAFIPVPSDAALGGMKPVAGEFDAQGGADIAFTGAGSSTTISVAYSLGGRDANGDVQFAGARLAAGNFPSLASASTAKLLGSY
ncbi:MAG TPA: FG-GAP-like repeat-containing protein [Polyangiaceae bacterium]